MWANSMMETADKRDFWQISSNLRRSHCYTWVDKSWQGLLISAPISNLSVMFQQKWEEYQKKKKKREGGYLQNRTLTPQQVFMAAETKGAKGGDERITTKCVCLCEASLFP